MNERQQRYYNEFRERVEAQGGTVITSGWKTNKTPMLVRCKAGHLAMPRPDNVKKGRGICRYCAGQGTTTEQAAENFRSAVADQGGEVLEPVWLGADTPHRIRCAEGHETTVRPTHVQQGRGICRFCAGRDSGQAWKGFRSAVADQGGEVLEPVWLGNNTPHRVRCAEGHETTVQPGHVQQGHGICRYCAGKVWDAFYIVANDDNGVIKFGITSGDPRPRLRNHRADGFERVILVRADFPEARDLETRVIRALDDAGEHPVRGREYFPARVLATVLDVAGHGAGAA